jgi:hypothetical protein
MHFFELVDIGCRILSAQSYNLGRAGILRKSLKPENVYRLFVEYEMGVFPAGPETKIDREAWVKNVCTNVAWLFSEELLCNHAYELLTTKESAEQVAEKPVEGDSPQWLKIYE